MSTETPNAEMELLRRISAELQAGNDEAVGELTRNAIDRSLPPKTILDQGLIAGMNVVGEKFKTHVIFLPDVLLAAKAMYAGMDLLKALLIKDNIPMIGKIVIGTVKGDLHDIGKNLVGVMLRGAGIEVIDLGNDVSPEQFVDAAEENGASIIGVSTLLTTTMPVMKNVVDLVKERGGPRQIRVLVGGAPVSEDYAREIGADGYAYDGSNAVERVKKML